MQKIKRQDLILQIMTIVLPKVKYWVRAIGLMKDKLGGKIMLEFPVFW